MLHDACGARGYPETRSAVRHIMEELGYQLIEEEYSGDSTQCCGYGGLTAYADRETAGDMAKSCLKTPGAQYVSYCMAAATALRGRAPIRGTYSSWCTE